MFQIYTHVLHIIMRLIQVKKAFHFVPLFIVVGVISFEKRNILLNFRTMNSEL